MTVFTGAEAIEEFLGEFDGWLSEPVHAYLLGGTAMTIHGLKDRTEDVDLALGAPEEFEHVYQSLRDEGFVVEDEPTESFEDAGRTVQLRHTDRQLQLDVFERQVVGKVWLTERMRDRADEFWTGKRVAASVLADEDMFLLKAVSGGDVGAGRHRDIEDMVQYAQRGLDYARIIEEVELQRPFNTGAVEATQIRERSHPLFAIEVAVDSLSGLPREFVDRVATFATEFEVEYFVLGAVDDRVHEVERIRDRVVEQVKVLSEAETDEVDAGVERLVRKRVLNRENGVVQTTA
jgi:hypothetical protein